MPRACRKEIPTLVHEFISLMNGISDIQYWVKDVRGRFLAANSAYVQAVGLDSLPQLIGKDDFQVSPHYLAQTYVKDDNIVLATQKPIHNKMELVKTPEGKTKWYSTSKVPLLSHKGNPWGTMGYTREVDSKNKKLIQSGIHSACLYMHENFEKPILVKNLARLANLSVIQFERNFKKKFQITPIKFLNQIRLKEASKLLIYSELKISDIASQSGFRNQSYFTKSFYEFMGSRPKDYRRAHNTKESPIIDKS